MSTPRQRSLPIVLLPRAVLATPERWVAGAALVLRAGRVAELKSGAGRLRRELGARGAHWVELEDAVVTPGLVNAHAHLELSALRGRVAAGARFVDWIASLLRERARLTPADWQASWRLGAERALSTGTTLVGDIDSSAAWGAGDALRAPRLRVYRELLDAGDVARTAQALERLREPWPRHPHCWTGYSPHAPHTLSDELLAGLARRAKRSHAQLGVHWAETAEEVRWLADGSGPFAPVLGSSPRTSGLERLARHGLLGARTALYHGNHPEPDDPERVARAGAALVHCPGTHAFFGRAPFELERWHSAGVTVALGTDSAASNDDLDLGRELALLRRAQPGLAPARAWDMATRAGARALGLARQSGQLLPGAWADLCVWELERGGAAAALEQLTAGQPRLRSVWIAGRERKLGGPKSGLW